MSDNIDRTKAAILGINKNPESGISHGSSKNRYPGPSVQKVAVYAKGGAVKNQAVQGIRGAPKKAANQAVQGMKGAEKTTPKQATQGIKGAPEKSPKQAVQGMKGVPEKAKNQGVQGFAKGGKVGHIKAIKGLLKGINDKLPMVAAAQAVRPKIVAPPPPAGIGAGGMPPGPPMAAGAPSMGGPPMQPGMKMGGKVKKLAAGGSAKVRKKSPMPDKIKMVNYPKGG